MLHEFIHQGNVYRLKSHLELNSPNEEPILFQDLNSAQAFFRSVSRNRLACEGLLDAAKWFGISNPGVYDKNISQAPQASLEQICSKISTGDILLVEIKPVPDKKCSYFHYESGIWTANTGFSPQLGQAIKIKVTNINVLGTTISVESVNTQETQQSILIPYKETEFKFTQFGAEPMNWEFKIRTESDVFSVKYKIDSSWVPGMPPNR